MELGALQGRPRAVNITWKTRADGVAVQVIEGGWDWREWDRARIAAELARIAAFYDEWKKRHG